MAKDSSITSPSHSQSDDVSGVSIQECSSQGDRSSGWLVRIAEQQLSSSQGSDKLSNSQPPEDEEVSTSSQGNGRPKGKGWLVAKAKQTMEFESEEDSLSQLPVDSSEHDSSQSSQPKPGEKGWLVALAEKSSDSAKAANYQQDRRQSLTNSQDRVSSLEKNRRASSSAFELLGSQEILSQLSHPEQNSPASETLGIMSIPDTGSVVPDLLESSGSETRNDRVQQEPKKDEAPSFTDDTLAQECSDIVKKLQPVTKKSVIGEAQGKAKTKVPQFKVAAKKKSGTNDVHNVHELLGKLKPVDVGVDSTTKSCPAPTPNKKAKTPKKIKTNTKKDSSVPKKPSFSHQNLSSLQGKPEQSFEEIFDSLISQSIFTSESRSQLDFSIEPSQSNQNPSQSKTKAPRKRKIAKKPKGEKATSKSASTKRKLNLKGSQDFLSKPPTKRVKPARCDETKSALLRLQDMRVCGTWAKCTNTACGKWRHLALKDPAEVREFFECRDNPDSRYSSCEAPEQLWSTQVEDRMVETRFTVGSLVWAKMAGWPAWPAMVDDDPDTGSFFWTEMVEDKWMDKPNSYHVIFFDKEVSRGWVSNSRIRKFDGIRPVTAKNVLGSRLSKAFEEAVSASEQSVTVRRRQHCLAARYKGPWGPVWPGCGEEEDGFEDGPDNLNLEQISQEIRSQPREQRDMSFIDKSFNCDVMDSVDSVFNNNDSSIDRVNNNDLSLPQVVAKKSKPPRSPKMMKSSVAVPKSKTPKKLSGKSNCKENIPPVSIVAHLYQNKDVFTAEMTEKIDKEPSGGLSVSFPDNDDILNSSLAREVDSALQLTNLFTPVKRTNLVLGDRAEISPGGPLTSSTPVRQVKPVLDSGDGDTKANDDKDTAEEAESLDQSTAFSDDGH